MNIGEWVMFAVEFLLGWLIVSMAVTPFLIWVIKNWTATGMWQGVCEFYYETLMALVKDHLPSFLMVGVIWCFIMGSFPVLSYMTALWLFQIAYSVYAVAQSGTHPLARKYP